MTMKELDFTHAYDKLDDRNVDIVANAEDAIARSKRLHEKCLELDILVAEALALCHVLENENPHFVGRSEPDLPKAA